MYSYTKKASDSSYEAQMYAELTLLYSNYIKYYANFKTKSQMLNLRMSEVSAKAKTASVEDILQNYEFFDGLI